MEGVYFISHPRKIFVGSEVRQRGEEANENCVNKLLLRQLGCLEWWETELFQLTDKGTGAFISQLPIHHQLKVESRGLDLP